MSDDRALVDEVLLGLYVRPPQSNQELRFRIEPLQAHRGEALEKLLAELDGTAHARDLAAAVLHEIAMPGDAERLVEALRAPDRGEPARAEISQVLVGVAGDRLSSLLEPTELADLSLWSIEAFLDRLRDPVAREPAIEIYRGSNAEDRLALLEAIASTTSRPAAKLRLGAALDPLFAEEPDPSLRTWMIGRLSECPEAASARALERWRSRCHGRERAQLEQALRRLGRRGIRERAESPRPLGWISGVDGTGCFSAILTFPSALGLRDVVIACVSVETGLRTASVLRAVEDDTSQEIARALDEGQGIPVATIEVATAAALIREAQDRTVALGLPLPSGSDLVGAYLQRPFGIAKPIAALETATVSRARMLALIDLPPYASWGFAPSEIDGESLGADVASRLAAMLRHQAQVHAHRSEHDLATRAAAAAREVEERGSPRSAVLRRLMERSLAAAAAPPARPQRSGIREVFKRRLEASARIRRYEVLLLDLAEALYRELESRSERATTRDRPTPPQLESLALRAAQVCVSELTRDSGEQGALPFLGTSLGASARVVRRRLRGRGTRIALEDRLEAAVGLETGLAPEPAREHARALTTVALWFAGEICLSRCRRGCLYEPGADGRALFFAPGHPAGIDTPGEPARGDGGVVSRALELALARRLDAAIARQAAFLDALGWVGLEPQGDDHARFARAEECLRRLGAVRSQLELARDDPPFVYSCVEEAESIERELATLRRRLFSAVVGRLDPPPPPPGAAPPGAACRAARRGFQSHMHKLGLFDVPLASVQAALERFESPSPLVAILAAIAPPRSARERRVLAERVRQLWEHSPRSALGGRTPAEAEPTAH